MFRRIKERKRKRKRDKREKDFLLLSFYMELYNEYCVDSRLYRLRHTINAAAGDIDAETMENRCVDELKKCIGQTRNTGLFKSLSPRIRERIFPEGGFEEWCSKIDKESTQTLFALKSRADRIDCADKQQIYAQMAQEQFSIGNVHDSLQMLSQAREHTGSRIKSALLLHDTIKYGLIPGVPGLDYTPLFTQLHRLAHPNTDMILTGGRGYETEQEIHFYTEVLPNNINALEGMYLLSTGDFKNAGMKLLSFCTESGTWRESGLINTVFSMHDVAVYITLCFLASFDRKTIKERLVNSPPFRIWQETCPEMGVALKAFMGLQYKTFLSLISRIPLKYDMTLCGNADSLIQSIQEQTLIQFIQPYSAVSFGKLEDTLGIPIQTLLPELEQLIDKGMVNAKIDSVKGVIVIQCGQCGSRAKMAEQVFAVGEAFQNLAESVLLRTSLSKNVISSKDENTIFD